jgi:CheY-like chemotaxis protein
VREITSDPDSAAIADAILAMAHSLQLAVIAEGVETRGQLATLRVRGCDRMQGYLFSRPVPAEELTQLLSDQRRLSMPAQDAGVEPTLLAVCAAEALDSLTGSPRGAGYRVYTADGAKAAFELLAQKDVLVVLCEQRMPEMGGIEFMWRVQALYPNTVRILLSADAETSAVREALERGIVHKALAAPWRDEDLRSATNAALELYRKRSRPPGPS